MNESWWVEVEERTGGMVAALRRWCNLRPRGGGSFALPTADKTQS
jgi:hypothetical protein